MNEMSYMERFHISINHEEMRDFYEKTSDIRQGIVERAQESWEKTQHPVARRMLQEVKKRVQKYHADFFVLDAEILGHYPYDQPFLWLVGEHGTNLERFYSTVQPSIKGKETWLMALQQRYHHRTTSAGFWIQGTAMTPIKIEELAKLTDRYSAPYSSWREVPFFQQRIRPECYKDAEELLANFTDETCAMCYLEDRYPSLLKKEVVV